MEAQGKSLKGDENKRHLDMDGLTISPYFRPEHIRKAKEYSPKAGQIIVASYPRSGTHWVMMMVQLILRKGKPFTSARDHFNSYVYLERMPQEISPFLPDAKCFRTHLPFDRLTYSPEAKYIYVIRHPSDVFISHYHLFHYLPIHELRDNSFDELFELFVRGRYRNYYGDYFDHLLSWYEQKNLSNVLLLTYESLKKNQEEGVLKIAKFLDESLVGKLVADGKLILNQILHESSFERMKVSLNSFYDAAFETPLSEYGPVDDIGSMRMKFLFTDLERAKRSGFKQTSSIVRKGTVGEGKSSLSEDQKRRLNERILEKTAHSDVMDLWKEDSLL